MLRLTPFMYYRPTSIEDAIRVFNEYDGEATYMGGGSDLMPNIKHRLASPKVVIGIRHLDELRGISVDPDGSLLIGGGVTLRALQASRLITDRYPALGHAASLISSPQVQRTATIGGNICLDVRCNYYNQSELWRMAIGYCMKKDSEICRVAPGGDRCWAVSSADTVPVLIGFDAEVNIVGVDGSRWQLLEGLYQDDGLIPTRLQPGEIVAQVRLKHPGRFQVIYEKLRIRKSFDFPLVGAATGIELAEGHVSRCRIVLTAVGSYPVRVVEAEEAVIGSAISDDVIATAGDRVFRAARPMDNTEGSIPHRKRMARVFVERGLRQLRGDA
jgi:4-hydroxybenzoyl-CoA reductase subunit beta